MTDRGWMVDDGTCLSCLQGQDWLCTKPVESYGDQWDRRTRLLCCCDNGYHVGYLDPDLGDSWRWQGDQP